MSRRNLLHKSKIEPFKQFLISKGYTLEKSNNIYEAIRATKDNKIISFYQKDTCDHLTATGRGISLAKEFIKMKTSTALSRRL